MDGLIDGTKGADIPPADRISILWRRIKEHRIAQWTVGYVAVAYGIQHAVTLTTEALDWPHAVTRVSILLLALGLPLAVTLAWYHGERVSREIGRGEMAIISLLLVVVSMLFYVFVRPVPETAPAAQQASIAAIRSASETPKGSISLAVLPFLNLSSDKEQEFFSDGMTEEITAALAKVPDLRVVARTSAFEFKGKNVNIRTMGEELGATHLIEGSVRKAGNRLRITAQLIKADDGTHVWAEDYDRELTDVFAIQEDIARAITASLHMTLALKPGENLINNRKIDPQAYTEFLSIRAAVTARNENVTRQEALRRLETLVVQQPNFAPAWAYLARIRFTVKTGGPFLWTIFARPPEDTRRLMQSFASDAEAAARQAIRLDPAQAHSYVVLGWIAAEDNNWSAAEDLLKQALRLDPDNADILVDNSNFARQTGHIAYALSLARRAQALEPLVSQYTQAVAMGLIASNQADRAVEAFEARPPSRGAEHAIFAEAYAAAGQFDKAATQVSMDRTDVGDGGRSVAATVELMRSLTAKQSPPKDLPPNPFLNWAQIYTGTPERVMALPELALRGRMLDRISPFDFAVTQARQTARYRKFARDAGLVDYWRARGWPDFCHPMTGDDFECS